MFTVMMQKMWYTVWIQEGYYWDHLASYLHHLTPCMIVNPSPVLENIPGAHCSTHQSLG
jgi:hypothetical protein